jgi:hypothetical protein
VLAAEQADEMAAVPEAAGAGDVGDGLLAVTEQPRGVIEPQGSAKAGSAL